LITSKQKHAEIAGAGMSGLAAAAALAQAGWSVRVHEKGTALRELGAGILVWENGLRALEDIGAYDAVIANSEKVAPNLLDHKGRVLKRNWMTWRRLYAVPRRHLHSCLAQAAVAAGVEILTDSEAAGARPDGTLILASGEEIKADLVIGADGVSSPVRNSLGLLKSATDLKDGGGRYMIDRLPTDPVGETFEQWNGGRRIGIVPCSPTEVYIFLCCPTSDAEGVRQTPFDPRTWIESFPNWTEQLNRIPLKTDSHFATFRDIQTSAWSKGRVALVGDAAQGMSPNLGQAACMALLNGVSLGHAVRNASDIEAALRAWEARERPVSEKVQDLSRVYGAVGTKWPVFAQGLRSALVRAMATPQFQRRLNFAADYFPSV
jgi:2-polyprenyl-6-methoxyphenol hydroxylase-like FAD-dependent oxidoreductase